MKRKIIIFLLFYLLTYNIYSQKNEAIAAGAAGVVAGIVGVKLVVDNLKEQFEHEAVEWVLANDSLYKFNLKLMSFEATKIDNLNSISAVPYIVRTPDSENSYVLIFVLSPGWYNQYGVDFTYVKPLKFNKKKWENIMLHYMNLASNVQFSDINKIPTYTYMLHQKAKKLKESDNDNNYILGSISGYEYSGINMPLSSIKNINSNTFVFKNEGNGKRNLLFPLIDYLDEDTHYVSKINEEIKIDFNEENLNIFLIETEDLFRMKRKILIDITKELYR